MLFTVNYLEMKNRYRLLRKGRYNVHFGVHKGLMIGFTVEDDSLTTDVYIVFLCFAVIIEIQKDKG